MSYQYELNQEAARSYGYDTADIIEGLLESLDVELLLDESKEAEDEAWWEEYGKLTDALGNYHIEDDSVLERAEQADEELAAIVRSAFAERDADANVTKLFDLVERNGI